MSKTNPYDVPNTCYCWARSDSECGCGGFVDISVVRAWQEGHDAAKAEVSK